MSNLEIPDVILTRPPSPTWLVTEEPTNQNVRASASSRESGGSNASALKYEESRMLLEQMSGQVEAGPAILAFLQGTDHLFMKKCKEYPEELFGIKPLITREIWNSSCRTIYYAGFSNGKCCSPGREFVYIVVDFSGRLVLKATGRQTGPGIKSTGTICLGDGTMIGTISQEFCDASYTIKDSNSTIVYKIQGPCFASCTPCVFWCFDESFEIDMADGVTEEGLIKTYWKDTHPEARGTFGLSFPIKMDTQHKALLLGSAFLIHYQYYRCGGNGTTMVILLALIGIGIAVGILGKTIFKWY